MTAKIQFHTAQYRRSQMTEPRGRGSWAFAVAGQTLFSPSMTYGEAKKWARERVREIAAGTKAAIVYVDVLP
jgi:hypothetical protein